VETGLPEHQKKRGGGGSSDQDPQDLVLAQRDVKVRKLRKRSLGYRRTTAGGGKAYLGPKFSGKKGGEKHPSRKGTNRYLRRLDANADLPHLQRLYGEKHREKKIGGGGGTSSKKGRLFKVYPEELRI